MKTNCLHCDGEMVTVQTEATAQVKTRFCKECGWIDNSFTKEAKEQLLKKTFKAEDLKDEGK